MSSATSPMMWRIYAQQHYRSAEIMYIAAHEAAIRNRLRMVAKLKNESPNSGILTDEEQSDYVDMNLFRHYLLLIGYTLECLIKGLLLSREASLVKNSSKIDKKIATHNLVALFEMAEIKLDHKEAELLHYIRECIAWRSKYPVPIESEDIRNPFALTPDASLIQGEPLRGECKKMLDSYVHRIVGLLDSVRELRRTRKLSSGSEA